MKINESNSNSFQLMLTILLCLIAFTIAIDLYTNPFSAMAPKNAKNYATKMAASIKDTQECSKFKIEIMRHAEGNQTDGKVITPMMVAKQGAVSAGCTN